MKNNHRNALMLLIPCIWLVFFAGCLATEFGGGAHIAPINRDIAVKTDGPLYNYDGYAPTVEINVALNKHKFLVSGMILGILIPFLYVLMKSYFADSDEEQRS